VETENPEEAEQLYRQGIEEFPRAISLQVAYGGFLVFFGRFSEGLSVAQKAVQLDPDSGEAMRLLGHALAVEGDEEGSRDAFEQAVELGPQRPSVHAYYGLSLIRVDEMEEAQEQLDIAVSLQPSSSVDFGSIALLFSALGKEAEAENYYLWAIEKAPDSSVQHANYARCLLALDRADEARKEMREAFELLPTAPIPTLLELRFYEFVIGDEPTRSEALAKLKYLIKDGMRSPAWDLGPAIDYGRDHGHDDTEWLASLAAVVENREEPEILDAWSKWSEASAEK
jgi:tetratricopeptide (TPR) repeat protein